MMPAIYSQDAARALCRTPLDSRHFDETGVPVSTVTAGLIRLAQFKLPFGYCGSLEAFWQFTDLHAQDNSKIFTNELEWLLRINGQAVAPYLNLKMILQPWGWPPQPIFIRLPVNAEVEFAVNFTPANPPGPPLLVAGRIFGRYWYAEE